MKTVGEVMARDLVTLSEEVALTEAAAAMNARHVGSALVVRDDRLIGILTERDVLHAVGAGRIGDRVADWMPKHPESVDAAASTQPAAVVMLHGGLRHLQVPVGRHPV